MVMEDDDRRAAGAYVDAAAELLALPLESVDRAVVVSVMQRLAAFSTDVASVALANDVEPAGRFEP